MYLISTKMNRQRLKILTHIIVLLHFCISTSAHGMRMRDDCKELTTNSQCQCTPVLSDFEILCPATEVNPKITVRVRPTNHVQIECSHIDAKEYKILPRMNIGYTPMVQIKQCPLPGHTPIARILEHLGITQVNSLIFETTDLGANLTRQHLNGLQGLGRLRFSSNGLSHMPEDIFNEFQNLTWLDLHSNNVQLAPNIFAPLENLNFLELGHNSLQDLPMGIFRNQRKLVHLNLWSNQLRNLTKDVFEGVSSVTDLDLSSNGIETFEPDVFSLLTNLSNINLNANRFHTLPKELFSHNKNLTQVRMTHNRVPLDTLPDGLFANLPNLKELRLTCDLLTLPGGLFANSSNIANLTISGNKLSTLPATLLADQINLLDLDLRRNMLESLPDELFANTKNLYVLKLSHNRLKRISRDLFASLENIEFLYMDNNHLTTIDPDAFVHTSNMRTIDMENNLLNLSELTERFEDIDKYELGSPFKYLFKLEKLNLRNNSILYIFRDWKFQLIELQELDLSYNNITSLNDNDLQYLSKQSVFLNLTHNNIHTINFETIDFLDITRVVRMDLNNNPLNCDCTLIRFLQLIRGELSTQKFDNVIKLNVDNLICAQPQNLEEKYVHEVLPQQLVCPLDHENSKQKRCPRGCECWVRSYDYILMVNCSNGNLTKVPALPRLDQLKLKGTELYIENNQLMKLPYRSTPGYLNVTKLYARGNNLTKIEAQHLPLGLSYLDIRDNLLQNLNESAITFLNNTRTVYMSLSGNPWMCDCEAKPLLQYTQLNYKLITDLGKMTCENFDESTNFQGLSVSDICPTEKELYIALAVVISLIGFLIGITAAFYYKYQQEIKVWLYAHNMCLWFVTEEELDKDKKYDAFISYSHKDEEFVKDLVAQLENGPTPFRLCVHVRDFIVGECIPDQIVRSVDDSRRTIVILSQNFIESGWARMEFNCAHQSALNEGRARVIVVIYGDIGDIESLDGELKAYLKMNTYLKADDPWFWSKLRYAMPHRTNKLSGLIKTPLKGSTDDKLELIKPSPVTPPLTTPPAEATKNPLVAHLNGGTPQTTIIISNGKGGAPTYYTNGKTQNGHINGAFIINTNAKQSDV
ncbi:protein toll-like [Teleopsis dalmanni]|uniref:protein toll-like n=1 Tax=Teleopsis dalmanni TaxID=139649 RepID=UPI0018CC9EC1|nr:protein toll-like [Teleopsis dalmanni]XP_037956856.1 protein toll-like [Teleopsis dalmanni]